jgi:hypothetical protein
MVEKHYVAFRHRRDVASGKRIGDAIPCGAFFADEILDGVGFGVSFSEEVSHVFLYSVPSKKFSPYGVRNAQEPY